MAQRAQRSLEAAKKAVPEGTFAVGIGLAVTGIATYGFFIACARGLSEKDYAAVIGGLWPLVFVVAPGCFLPLEQEVGRALAHRRGSVLVRSSKEPGKLAISRAVWHGSQPESRQGRQQSRDDVPCGSRTR